MTPHSLIEANMPLLADLVGRIEAERVSPHSPIAYGSFHRFPAPAKIFYATLDGTVSDLHDVPLLTRRYQAMGWEMVRWATDLDSESPRIILLAPPDQVLDPAVTSLALAGSNATTLSHLAVDVDPPEMLLPYDGQSVYLRRGGHWRYDEQERAFVPADPLTRNQAKLRARNNGEGDILTEGLRYIDLRARLAHLAFDPQAPDEENGTFGLWLECPRGHVGAVAYWHVTVVDGAI
jgi:hypothetical protein